MSFGYGVGDVIAVLGLIKRAADEIRHYRDAPRHFQQLEGELDIYHTTIQSILTIEPASQESFVIVQRMRCIALFSRLPLQRFIDLLHAKQGVLGHHGTARSLSSIGTRLHWSMIDRKDVGALRDTLFSVLLAINVLQGRLLELHIQKLGPELGRLAAAQSQHLAVFAHELELFRDTAEKAPKAIRDLKSAIEQGNLSNAGRLDSIQQDMTVVQSNITTIQTTFDTVAVFGKALGNKLLTTLDRILTVVTQLLKMIKVLTNTSQKVLRNMSEGVSILLDIRREMKRLARSIDAMPVQIGLELIRFDDMFGESWALPFQACTEWQSVEHMINTVIFANKRPGRAEVLKGQFCLTIGDNEEIISKTAWNTLITSGMQVKQCLSMADLPPMIDLSTPPEWPTVALAISDTLGGAVCSDCRRAHTTKEIDTGNLRLLISDGIMFKLHLNRTQQQALTSKGWVERPGLRTPLGVRDYVVHLGRERFMDPFVRLAGQGETKHMALDEISEGETEEFSGQYLVKQFGPFVPSVGVPGFFAVRDALMRVT